MALRSRESSRHLRKRSSLRSGLRLLLSSAAALSAFLSLPSQGACERREVPGPAIQPRVFFRSAVAERLRGLGIDAAPDWFSRLPGSDGIRITLASREAIELRCDGTHSRIPIPSAEAFFRSDGTPFAWYEDQRLIFRSTRLDPEIGNVIRVDPAGFYFATIARRADVSRIYATTDPSRPVGTTPIVGPRTRLFSRADEVVVVGELAGSVGVVWAIRYQATEGRLVEVSRVEIPRPPVWVEGWLVARDSTPDLSQVLFLLLRDSPFGNKFYSFDFSTGELTHLPKLSTKGAFEAFVACDPIGDPGPS